MLFRSLFTCCLEFAAILSKRQDSLSLLKEVGSLFGLIFQIKDDLLEANSTQEALGKSPLSDSKNQKATYLSILGAPEAQKALDGHLDKCKDLISKLDNPAVLESFLVQISQRTA